MVGAVVAAPHSVAVAVVLAAAVAGAEVRLACFTVGHLLCSAGNCCTTRAHWDAVNQTPPLLLQRGHFGALPAKRIFSAFRATFVAQALVAVMAAVEDVAAAGAPVAAAAAADAGACRRAAAA